MRVKSKLILFDVMNGTKEEITNTIDAPTIQKWQLFHNNGMTFWASGRALK